MTDRETADLVALLDDCADRVRAALDLDSEDRAVVWNSLSPVLTAARASSPPSPGLVEAVEWLWTFYDTHNGDDMPEHLEAALRAALPKEPTP